VHQLMHDHVLEALRRLLGQLEIDPHAASFGAAAIAGIRPAAAGDG
jgi:hypothetical protein